MKEEWKYVKGYENYIVSNTGKVVSLDFHRTGKPKELKHRIDVDGMHTVDLYKNKKSKRFYVGRLVAEHFIPNPNHKPRVMHIKDLNSDSVDNLMWAYPSEICHNTFNRRARKGLPNFVRITYKGGKYNNYRDIAKDFGISTQNFYNRFYILNWGLEEAIEIPIRKVNRKRKEIEHE
jgi:hypothetical protein